MKKTVVFVTFAFVACVAIVGAVVLLIERPDASATFIALIVTVLTTVAGFAATVYGLGRVNEKVDVAVKQTNGNLSAKEAENKRLLRLLEENGISAHES